MQFKEQRQQQQQRQTVKEVIAANVQHLIQQLEQGHSDTLTAYLTAMSRFHNYSFGNVLEIARQKPDATHVAGLHTWNQLGRKSRDKMSRRPKAQSYRITGDVGENRDPLLAFIERQGIELYFTEKIAPALGISYGGRIAILSGQSRAEEFSTLVHELSHEMLHKAERRTATTQVLRETEAEAIAFVISKAVGLEAGTASADYIHLYHGNASLLAESLEVIQQTSAVILAALQPPNTPEQKAALAETS
jgi:hypothetical protein